MGGYPLRNILKCEITKNSAFVGVGAVSKEEGTASAKCGSRNVQKIATNSQKIDPWRGRGLEMSSHCKIF